MGYMNKMMFNVTSDKKYLFAMMEKKAMKG